MLSYRVMLDVPFQLAAFVSDLLAEHRRELGTRAGTRALTCWSRRSSRWPGSGTGRTSAAWAPASGSPRPPPTGTRTRPSRCSPRRPRLCARPWTRPSSRGFPTSSWTARSSPPTVRGQEDQPEGQRDR